MKKLTKSEFIEKAKKVHGNKYDYSKIQYKGIRKKITIVCSVHGEFNQEARNHLKGSGCSKCYGNFTPTNKDFIKKASKIHQDKYDYSISKYVNSYTKIKITCPIHGVFNQTPNNHLMGSGCEKCKSKSKGELSIRDFLNINSIKSESQKYIDGCINPKTNRKLKFDFYIKSKNAVVEYDGKHHFEEIPF